MGWENNTKNVKYKCYKKIKFKGVCNIKGRVINFVLEIEKGVKEGMMFETSASSIKKCQADDFQKYKDSSMAFFSFLNTKKYLFLSMFKIIISMK